MFSNASKSRFSIVWVPITNMLPALDSVTLWGKGISFFFFFPEGWDESQREVVKMHAYQR